MMRVTYKRNWTESQSLSLRSKALSGRRDLPYRKLCRAIKIGMASAMFLSCAPQTRADDSTDGNLEEGVKRLGSSEIANANKRTRRENRGFIESTARSDVERIPTLAYFWIPQDGNKSISVSGLCHLLLFYGLGRTDLCSFPKGGLALKALTNKKSAKRVLGCIPFIRTQNGLRYSRSRDLGFSAEVGEVYRDQCLATFARLELPLDTAIKLGDCGYTISDLLSESVATFSFERRELALSSIAYARYLAPRKSLGNRFQIEFSFSELVERLLRGDLNAESCYGIHVLEALIEIRKADERYSILDAKARSSLDDDLGAKVKGLVGRQQMDGSWPVDWCSEIKKAEGKRLGEKLLVTGHLLEMLNRTPADLRPNEGVYVDAAKWLMNRLNSSEVHSTDHELFCAFTHAAKAAREVLGRE